MFRRVCKQITIGAVCIGVGVIVSWAILTSAAQEQANREATALTSKVENARVGQHIKINGHGFLKTSHARSVSK